ncbi:MAG: hypothetical protein HQ591_02065 [candidate division Zixibacteria bacterium]|nr:hypothetical protein [Candidatus Tariuqbacter arcticus]
MNNLKIKFRSSFFTIAAVLVATLFSVSEALADQALNATASITPITSTAGSWEEFTYTVEPEQPGTLDQLNINNPFRNPLFLTQCSVDGESKFLLYFSDPASIGYSTDSTIVNYAIQGDTTIIIYTYPSLVNDEIVFNFQTQCADSAAVNYYEFSGTFDDYLPGDSTALGPGLGGYTVTITHAAAYYLEITDEDGEPINSLDILTAGIDTNLFAYEFDVYGNQAGLADSAVWEIVPGNSGSFTPETGGSVSFHPIIAGNANIIVSDTINGLISDNLEIDIEHGDPYTLIILQEDSTLVSGPYTADDSLILHVRVLDSLGNVFSPDELGTTDWDFLGGFYPNIYMPGYEIQYQCSLTVTDGYIKATFGSAIDSTDNFDIIPGAPVSVSIWDDDGPVEENMYFTAGQTWDLYLKGADSDSNFIEAVEGYWTTSLSIGDFDVDYGSAVTFTAMYMGESVINAEYDINIWDETGNVTVMPGPAVSFQVLQEDNTPVPDSITITAVEERIFHVEAFDFYNNPISEDTLDTNTVWSKTGSIPWPNQVSYPDTNHQFTYFSNDSVYVNGWLHTVFKDTLEDSIHIDIQPGAISEIWIYTTEGNTIATTNEMQAGDPWTLYVYAEDQHGNHINNVSGNWIDDDSLGSFSATYDTITTFTAERADTGLIRVEVGDFSDVTGNVTVTYGPPYQASILQENGTPVPDTITTDLTLYLHVDVYDFYGNPLPDTAQILTGTVWNFLYGLQPNSAQYGYSIEYSCTTAVVPAGVIRASVPGISPVETGDIRVEPGAPADITILEYPGGGSVTNPDSVQAGWTWDLELHVEDQYGNNVPAMGYWDIIGDNIGDFNVDLDYDSLITFTAMYTGQGYIKANIGELEDSTGVITVRPGAIDTVYILRQDSTMIPPVVSTDDILLLHVVVFDTFGNQYDSTALRTTDWRFVNLYPYTQINDTFSIEISPHVTHSNAKIWATFNYKDGYAEFEVVPGAPDSIVVKPQPNISIPDSITQLDLTAGEQKSLYVFVFDSCDNVIQGALGVWSDFPDIIGYFTPGTGDSTVFTAEKQGGDSITVQAEGLTYVISPVNIVPAPLDSVEIHLTPQPSTPASSLELISGNSAALYCFAFDSLHNYKENYQFSNINWHCEPSGIGEFNPQSSNPTNFTALEAVSGQIWVSADGKEDYLENVLVTPDYGHIAQLAIQYEVIPGGNTVGAVTMAAGSTLVIHSIGYDPHGNYLGAVESTWGTQSTANPLFSGLYEPPLGDPTTTLTFNATGNGEGYFTATSVAPDYASGMTGLVTVVSNPDLSSIKILESENPESGVFGDDSMTCDESVYIYIHGYDFFSNPYTITSLIQDNLEISVEGDFGGEFSPIEVGDTYLKWKFEANEPGGGRIKAAYALAPEDSLIAVSNTVTVYPGEIAGVEIVIDSASIVPPLPVFTNDDTLYFGYFAWDEDNNPIPPEMVMDRYDVLWDYDELIPYDIADTDPIIGFFTYNADSVFSNKSLSVDINGVDDLLSGIYIEHGIPWYSDPHPFIFDVDPEIIVFDDNSHITSPPILDQDSIAASNEPFTVSTSIGNLSFGGSYGTTLTIETDNEGVLDFYLLANDSTGGMASIIAESDNGYTMGEGSVQIAHLSIDTLTMSIDDDPVEIWAGINSVQVQFKITNQSGIELTLEQLVLLFTPESMGSYFTGTSYLVPNSVISAGDSIEGTFTVFARDDLPSGQDITVSASCNYWFGTTWQTGVLEEEGELHWHTNPGRNPNSFVFPDTAVTRGLNYQISLQWSDAFNLPDDLAGSYIEVIVPSETTWVTTSIDPSVWQGSGTHSFDFAPNITIPLLPNESTTADVKFHLHRTLEPGASYDSLVILSDMTIYPRASASADTADLTPNLITIGDRVSFVCDFALDDLPGALQFTMNEAKFYPDRTNADDFAEYQSTTANPLVPGETVTLTFEDFTFYSTLWTGNDYFPKITIEGQDEIGSPYSFDVLFDEPIHLFEPVYVAYDDNSLEPLQYVNGGDASLFIDIVNSGDLLVTLSTETYLDVEGYEQHLLEETDIPVDSTVTLQFDSLQSFTFEPGYETPVLYIRQTDELDFNSEYDFSLSDSIAIYNFAAPQQTAWTYTYPTTNHASSSATSSIILTQSISNPLNNTWIEIDAVILEFEGSSGDLIDTVTNNFSAATIAGGEDFDIEWELTPAVGDSGEFEFTTTLYYTDSLGYHEQANINFPGLGVPYYIHTPPNVVTTIDLDDDSTNFISNYTGQIPVEFSFVNSGGTGLTNVGPLYPGPAVSLWCGGDSISSDFYSFNNDFPDIPANSTVDISRELVIEEPDSIPVGLIEIRTNNIVGINEYNYIDTVGLSATNSQLRLYEPTHFTAVEGLRVGTITQPYSANVSQGENFNLCLDLSRDTSDWYGPVVFDNLTLSFKNNQGATLNLYFSYDVIYPALEDTIFTVSDTVTCSLSVTVGFEPIIVGEVNLEYSVTYRELYPADPATMTLADPTNNVGLVVASEPFMEVSQIDIHQDTVTQGQIQDWQVDIYIHNENNYNAIFVYDTLLIDILPAATPENPDTTYAFNIISEPNYVLACSTKVISVTVDTTGNSLGSMLFKPTVIGHDSLVSSTIIVPPDLWGGFLVQDSARLVLNMWFEDDTAQTTLPYALEIPFDVNYVLENYGEAAVDPSAAVTFTSSFYTEPALRFLKLPESVWVDTLIREDLIVDSLYQVTCKAVDTNFGDNIIIFCDTLRTAIELNTEDSAKVENGNCILFVDAQDIYLNFENVWLTDPCSDNTVSTELVFELKADLSWSQGIESDSVKARLEYNGDLFTVFDSIEVHPDINSEVSWFIQAPDTILGDSVLIDSFKIVVSAWDVNQFNQIVDSTYHPVYVVDRSVVSVSMIMDESMSQRTQNGIASTYDMVLVNVSLNFNDVDGLPPIGENVLVDFYYPDQMTFISATGLDGMPGGSGGDKWGLDDDTTQTLTFSISGISETLQLTLSTGSEAFDAGQFRAVIDESSLPLDGNSLPNTGSYAQYSSPIAVDTAEVNMGFMVEERLELHIIDPYISKLKVGENWVPVFDPDTLIIDDLFMLSFSVENNGEAPALLFPDFNEPEDSVWVFFETYQQNIFNIDTTSWMLKVALEEDIEIPFEAIGLGNDSIIVSIMEERVQDANSLHPLVEDLTCFLDACSLKTVMEAQLNLGAISLTEPCSNDIVSSELKFRVEAPFTVVGGIDFSTVSATLTVPQGYTVINNSTVSPDPSDSTAYWFVQAPAAASNNDTLRIEASALSLTHLDTISVIDEHEIDVDFRARIDSVTIAFDESESQRTRYEGTVSTYDTVRVDVTVHCNDVDGFPEDDTVWVDFYYPDQLTLISQGELDGMDGGLKGNNWGFDTDTSAQVFFVMNENTETKYLDFYTGEDSLNAGLFQVVVDEDLLPFDDNSLPDNLFPQHSSRIAVQTPVVSMSFTVEERLELYVINPEITEIKSGAVWVPATNPESIALSDSFKVSFRVENWGQAPPQIYSDWRISDSVWVYFDYDDNIFDFSEPATDTILVKLDTLSEARFCAIDTGAGSISVFVHEAKVRDANSMKNVIEDTTCFAASTNPITVTDAVLNIVSSFLPPPCSDDIISTELIFEVKSQLSVGGGIDFSSIEATLNVPPGFTVVSGATVLPDPADSIVTWQVQASENSGDADLTIDVEGWNLNHTLLKTDNDIHQVHVVDRCVVSVSMDYDANESERTYNNGIASTYDTVRVDVNLNLNGVDGLPVGESIVVDFHYPDQLGLLQVSGLDGMNGGLRGHRGGFDDDTTQTLTFTISSANDTALTQQLEFYTNTDPFGPEDFTAVIDMATLPLDANSLTEQIAVDTVQATKNILVEDRLKLHVIDCAITAVLGDTGWIPLLVEPDSVGLNSSFKVSFEIKNWGDAPAQIYENNDWRYSDSVWVYFDYNQSLFTHYGVLNPTLLPLDSLNEIIFTADAIGSGDIRVAIVEDSVRDANSYQTLIEDSTCFADTTNSVEIFPLDFNITSTYLSSPCFNDIVSTELEFEINAQLAIGDIINFSTVACSLAVPQGFQVIGDSKKAPDPGGLAFWSVKASETAMDTNLVIYAEGWDVNYAVFFADTNSHPVFLVDRCVVSLSMEMDGSMSQRTQNGIASTYDTVRVNVNLNLNDVDGVPYGQDILVDFTYPDNTSEILTFTIDDTILTQQLAFWTGAMPFGPANFIAEIDTSSLPLDANSFTEQIAVDTAQASKNIVVEERLELHILDAIICAIWGDTSWIPLPEAPDSLAEGDSIKVSFKIDNYGEAPAQINTDYGVWFDTTLVWIYFDYDPGVFSIYDFTNPTLFPLDSLNEVTFRADTVGVGDIRVAIVEDSVRDANSYQTLIEDSTCFADTTKEVIVTDAVLSIASIYLGDPCTGDAIISTELLFEVNSRVSVGNGIDFSSIEATLIVPSSFTIISGAEVSPNPADSMVTWQVQASAIAGDVYLTVVDSACDVNHTSQYIDVDSILVHVVDRCVVSVSMDYDSTQSANTRNGTASTYDTVVVSLQLNLNDVDGVPYGETIEVAFSYPDSLTLIPIFSGMSGASSPPEFGYIGGKGLDKIGGSSGNTGGFDSDTVMIIPFLIDGTALTQPFAFYTDTIAFNSGLFHAEILESSLPLDANSLIEQIAVDTAEANLNITVEERLLLVMDSLYISELSPDTTAGYWAEPFDSDTICTGNYIRIPVAIENQGDAAAEIQDPGETTWYECDSVWVHLVYDNTISNTGSDIVKIPLDGIFEAVFKTEQAGNCNLTVSVLDSTRDINSYQPPPECTGNIPFEIVARGAPDVDSTDFVIVDSMRNRAEFTAVISNDEASPFKIFMNKSTPRLRAYSYFSGDSLILEEGIDYNVTVSPVIDTVTNLQPVTVTWYFSFYINQTVVNYDTLIVETSTAVEYMSKYLDINSSSLDTMTLNGLSYQGGTQEIAPPYVDVFFIYPLASGQANSGTERQLAAVFNEDIIFNDPGNLRPDSVFYASVPNFYSEGADFDQANGNMLYFSTEISDSFFVEGSGFRELLPKVKLYLNPNCQLGIIADIDDNNVIGRAFYGLPTPISPVPYEFEPPDIEFVDGEYWPGTPLKLHYRVYDLPLYYACGMIGDSIHAKIYVWEYGSIIDTLDTPVIEYYEIDPNIVSGPNLTLIIYDYSFGDDLRIWISAADLAGNNSVLIHNYTPAQDTPVQTLLYPSPWDPNEPLYLQYTLYNTGQLSVAPIITIYNINGDKVTDLGRNWISAILNGPASPIAPGVHRYILDTEELNGLPNGVYIAVFNPHFPDKAALPLNVLKSAKYFRSSKYGTQ